MKRGWRVGVCVIAIAAVAASGAEAAKVGKRPDLKCASAPEVAAIQTTVVDQQLVDAALTCGDEARSGFNSYRMSFGPELRVSDKLLLTMFKRVLGPAKGDAAYNLFKTEMASKAELRRTHDAQGFCQAASLVLAAANAPVKPSLRDFVAGVPVADTETPVTSCAVSANVTLAGARVLPPVAPTPRPESPTAPVVLASTAPPPRNTGGIKVGSLTCNVSGGVGLIFGSSKELKCTFSNNAGQGEHYTGTFSKYGLDIGFADKGVLVWGVVAPTADMRNGALEGDYAGATASATVGVGLGANVLIGGTDKSIALQPVSVEGNTGLNVAAGVGVITLKAVRD